MEINDDLREMLKELGHAINESISGSGRVHDSIQRIRDEGYNLYMVLDAKVGVNRRSSRTGLRRRRRSPRTVARRRSASEAGKAVAATGEQAAFRINIKDLRFLKSMGIDPTRKVRGRRGVTSRLTVRRAPTRA